MMKNVILQFKCKLYRAPDILAFYLMAQKDADDIQKILREDAKRKFSFGELEGKHSDTRRSGADLAEGLTVISDIEKVAAFKLIFDDLSPDRPWSYFGSCDILELLQENMY